jgi:hypothetical protein
MVFRCPRFAFATRNSEKGGGGGRVLITLECYGGSEVRNVREGVCWNFIGGVINPGNFIRFGN